MNSSATIVLPGLDGTDFLLERFASLAPPGQSVRVNALPDDPTDNYDSLCGRISTQIQELDSCHLIAESFSGPLGILLAHRYPKIINRLTLVATFADSPTPKAARIIPWSLLFRFPMPTLIARRYFVGPNRWLIDELRNAVRQTSPKTLVQRMHCLMNVDVTTQLSELKCDVMYLRPKHDRLVPKRSLNTIMNANLTVSVCEIDGPHLILQTQPELAWECIVDGPRIPYVR